MTKDTPIAALFDDNLGPNLDADPRSALHGADVIFGVDVMSRNEFLVYGRKSLERIASSGTAKQLKVLRISLDQETNELEKLVALIQQVKGSHDYEPSQPE